MHYFSHFRQAIATGIIGLILTLIASSVLWYLDNQKVRASLQSELMSLQREVGKEVRAHVFGLTWIARQHADRPNREGASWLDEGEIIQTYYPNFSAFLWVNETGSIEAAYPVDLAKDLVGTRFDEQTGQSLESIRHNSRHLIQAGTIKKNPLDILIITPHLASQPKGYYIAILNSEQLLHATLATYLNDGSMFQIRSSNNQVLFDFAGQEKHYDAWRATSTVHSFEQELHFELWPSPERLNTMRSKLPLLVLLAGLSATALMTASLYVLGISRVRAQELADTNIDLYIEIEERERVEKRMAYLASHDLLTGLANRHALNEHLEKALKGCNCSDKRVGALIIDLDNFKDVNDALGHTLGDELLKSVAKRLAELQPESGLLARLGGDEFAMTVVNIPSVSELECLAEQALEALNKQFFIEDYELFVSGSIGLAINQASDEEPDDLMRNADTALYRAKELGRSVYHVYSHKLHEELNARIELVKRLREAVDKEHLSVFYQPKIDMASRRIVGVEALVRWIDEDGSIIGPDQFIPVAEDTGLIIPISNFVLKTACTQLKRWHDMGMTELQLSVNLSGKQLQSPDLMDYILSVIDETGIPSHLLELELTEQVFIENIKSHTNFMHAVREEGVTLAIDDFGVGYSSLSYLKHFPVNVLKIDRSFVQDLPDDKDDATITQTIINLANSLDLELVAEGVETEEQVSFLTERGCIIGQGFLFSRPIPSSEMTELLTRYEGLVPIQIIS